MAIARQGRSITFTAVNAAAVLNSGTRIVAATFQGTGLTASQRLVVRDSATVGSGNILIDYITEGTADNGDLWGGRAPQYVEALSIDNNTIGGTWVLTVTVEV